MFTLQLTESGLSSLGLQLGKTQYVVALVIFKGPQKNMLQPMLPLGPSVSLLEPQRCTPELGHVAAPTVLQHFGSPGYCDTLTRMLCVVQSCDTSVRRSCE